MLLLLLISRKLILNISTEIDVLILDYNKVKMTTPDIMKAALLGAQFSADFFESDEETTNATNSIMLEHDYAKEEWINDANSNRSISNLNDSSEAFINTTFSTEESLNNSGEILIEEGVGFNTSASAETMEQTHEDRGNYDETATLDQQGGKLVISLIKGKCLQVP